MINDAVKRDAPVLIPAFAVGRTQELIYLIRELEDEKAIPVLPVTVDSPMAAATTRAYANAKGRTRRRLRKCAAQTATSLANAFDDDCIIERRIEELNDAQGARVIISASGMMTGGRVLHHALRLVPDPDATLVFVGYQAAGTLGGGFRMARTEVKILGQWVPVVAVLQDWRLFRTR